MAQLYKKKVLSSQLNHFPPILAILLFFIKQVFTVAETINVIGILFHCVNVIFIHFELLCVNHTSTVYVTKQKDPLRG